MTRNLRRALLTATALLTTALAAGPAEAASTCAAQHLAIQPLQSRVFYIDAATSYLGSYVGYRVTSTDTTPRSGLWQRLESFTGGVVAPASGGTTTAPLAVDAIAGGGSTTTYSYLKATGATTASQTHDVVLYSGRPGAGGTELCRETETISRVYDVVKASSNKVTGGSLSSATAALGSTFQLTVNGATGVIGSGQSDDPGVVRFSPAVAASWPSRAFRLIGVSHQLPLGGAVTPDVLWRGGMDGPDRDYGITYTFRVVGPTTGPTPVVPVQNIASGTVVKHTDPGSLGTLAPIPTVTSTATMAVAAGGTPPFLPGAHVPLTATVTNTGSGSISLDEVVLRLPAGWSPVAGSATAAGTPVADPFAAGDGTLHLVGPFTVPGAGTLTLGLDASAGAAGTSGSYTALATLAGGQIDGTLDPADNSPASTTLTVLGAPTAHDDALTGHTGLTTALDVLANDATGNGAAAITIASPPAHGTAVVNGDHIDYTADALYAGPDALSYTITTPGGSSTAQVALTVVDLPLPPAAAALSSTGTGTAVQSQTATIPGGGTVTLLDAGGNPATTVTVAGVGTYALDPVSGVISFTPAAGFSGTAAGVSYRVADSHGQTATSTYQPTVLAPAGPTAAALTSTGSGTDVQGQHLAVPAGGSVALLDGSGQPVSRLDVPGVGTYVLDTTTGDVSFVPVLGFSGAAPVIRYRVLDAYNQVATGTYIPSVVLPAAPLTSSGSTAGPVDAPQTFTIPVPAGGSVMLLDGATPVTKLTVAGEGTYEVAPDTGVITFTPEPGWVGTSRGIPFVVADAYGSQVTGTYTPSVAPAAALPATTDVTAAPAGPAPAGAAPAPVAHPSVAAPRPSVLVGATQVTSAGGDVLPVACRVAGAAMASCEITLTATIAGHEVVVGHGLVRAPHGAAPRLPVRVQLTKLGTALVHQLGGQRVRIAARVRPAGGGRVVSAAARTLALPRSLLLPRPVFFGTASAALRAGEHRYLRRLRARLAHVRGVRCTGYTDSRDGRERNRALGLRRAVAACAVLTGGSRVQRTVGTYGEDHPHATNATAAGRQRNRRTAIRLRY